MLSNPTEKRGGESERPILSYLGPLSDGVVAAASKNKLGGVKFAFVIVVGIPTLVAVVYCLFIASPIYVSEAKFIVRTQAQEAPSSLGIALQRVGLAASSSDAFAVHEYINSRDAVRDLERRMNLREALSRSHDPIEAFPRGFEGQSREDLYKAFKRFVTVGYDSTNGISTLRVKAFSPQDAQRIADALLTGGEGLVNDLNVRASQNSIKDAQKSLVDAEMRLQSAQAELTAFRSSAEYIDPAKTANEGAQLIGSLMINLASVRAERAQVAEGAPESPQLSILDSRIRAFEREIEAEKAKLAGEADSLAPKIGVYENLVLNREIADRSLAAARSSLDEAETRARRQGLYLDRVVNPNLPDKAILPKRWWNIMLVFLTSLLVFSIGALVWAGLREHRQEQ